MHGEQSWVVERWGERRAASCGGDKAFTPSSAGFSDRIARVGPPSLVPAEVASWDVSRMDIARLIARTYVEATSTVHRTSDSPVAGRTRGLYQWLRRPFPGVPSSAWLPRASFGSLCPCRAHACDSHSTYDCCHGEERCLAPSTFGL